MFFLDKKSVPAVAAAGRVDDEKGKNHFPLLLIPTFFAELSGRFICENSLAPRYTFWQVAWRRSLLFCIKISPLCFHDFCTTGAARNFISSSSIHLQSYCVLVFAIFFAARLSYKTFVPSSLPRLYAKREQSRRRSYEKEASPSIN